jgi:hypothetical protein
LITASGSRLTPAPLPVRALLAPPPHLMRLPQQGRQSKGSAILAAQRRGGRGPGPCPWRGLDRCVRQGVCASSICCAQALWVARPSGLGVTRRHVAELRSHFQTLVHCTPGAGGMKGRLAWACPKPSCPPMSAWPSRQSSWRPCHRCPLVREGCAAPRPEHVWMGPGGKGQGVGLLA